MPEDENVVARTPWVEQAHEGQLEPEGSHSTWLILAGRGFGKTRAGAEWVAEKIRTGGKQRIALVAATLDEARNVMIEGDSGLRSVAGDIIERYYPSRGEIHFTNGSIAQCFSGASPQKLRGSQFHLAWCDELAKWSKCRDSWDNLQFALRLGDDPRAMVTTTPAASEVLERLLDNEDVAVTRGTTFDNKHLCDKFKAKVLKNYGDTHRGRVELYGEMPPPDGALWTPEMIAAARTDDPIPAFDKLAIGVDPPAGGGVCGIVACGRDSDGQFHVIGDHSVGEASPAVWSGKVRAAAVSYDDRLSDGRAVEVVAETNQGGRMVEEVLHGGEGQALKVSAVRAAVGKSARAEPIAMLFESGRVKIHGRFPELEKELCGLIAGGGYDGPGTSPDRADAMVWALTSLNIRQMRYRPQMRRL